VPLPSSVSGPGGATPQERTGDIIVGHRTLRVGSPHGSLVLGAAADALAIARPRPDGPDVRPRPIRRLIGREAELDAVARALAANVPVEISGRLGSGRTALIRQLAHDEALASRFEGVVYLPVRERSLGDVLQTVFDGFLDRPPHVRSTNTEMRRALLRKRALVLLDDVQWPRERLEELVDTLPECGVVVVTTERTLFDETHAIALGGLEADQALSLIERDLGRSLDASELAAAASTCDKVDRHPATLRQMAALVREHGGGFAELDTKFDGKALEAFVLSTLGAAERRVLTVLSAVTPTPLGPAHLAALTERTNIDAALRTLEVHGLVEATHGRYALAGGASSALALSHAELDHVRQRARALLLPALVSTTPADGAHDEIAEVLLGLQRHLADEAQWEPVIALARALSGPLALAAAWGDWEQALDRGLRAARARRDLRAEALMLHELGTRALCLGRTAQARLQLEEALDARKRAGDQAGEAATRTNLIVLGGGSPQEPTAFTPRSAQARSAPPVRSSLFELLDGLELDSASPTTPVREPDTGPGLILDLDSEPDPDHEQPEPEAPPAVAATPPTALSHDREAAPARGDGRWSDLDVGPADRVRRDDPVPADELDVVDWELDGVPEMQPVGRRRRRWPVVAALVVIAGGAAAVGWWYQAAGVAPAAASGADILAFAPVQASIAPGTRVDLCFEMVGVMAARIDQGVGEVNLAQTRCVAVAPAETATYTLTAVGADGVPVRAQTVVAVEAASGESAATAEDAVSPASSEGAAATASVTLESSPPVLRFGVIPAGQSTTRTVRLTNRGDAAVRLRATEIRGRFADDFAVLRETCGESRLAVGRRCTVSVGFTPSGDGSRTALLALVSDAGVSTTVALEGEGQGENPGPSAAAPVVQAPAGQTPVQPAVLAFGTIAEGGGPEVRTVSVVNRKETTLRVAALEILGPHAGDFVVQSNGCAGQRLAPGEVCRVQIRARPGGEGRREARLMIWNNDLSGPYRVELAVTGVTPVRDQPGPATIDTVRSIIPGYAHAGARPGPAERR
jgi:hypothetical protein